MTRAASGDFTPRPVQAEPTEISVPLMPVSPRQLGAVMLGVLGLTLLGGLFAQLL